jgi:hypothetical protein
MDDDPFPWAYAIRWAVMFAYLGILSGLTMHVFLTAVFG